MLLPRVSRTRSRRVAAPTYSARADWKSLFRRDISIPNPDRPHNNNADYR